ncbi:MAG: DNA repair protein RecN [Desulfovibrio sp.]
MLELLRIKNLALIDDAEIELHDGMNVLTGETGAGKSFILKAIDFLTGEKMATSLVRPGREKAEVEALFVMPEGDLVIRRELSASTGRSRIYINDRLSSQETVRSMRPRLVVHTSQHGQQKLMQPSYQAAVLDSFLKDQSILIEKNQLRDQLKELLAKKESVRIKAANLMEKREFLLFQQAEIDKVDPQAGEEDELLDLQKRVRSKEQAAECFNNALTVLCGEVHLADGLSLLASELDAITAVSPEFAADAEAVTEFRHHLGSLEARLRRGPSLASDDGEELDINYIESRLFEIAKLKRKLGKTLDQIVEQKAEIDENLSFLDSCQLELQQLEVKEAEIVQALKVVLDSVNNAREEAAETLCRQLESELKDLGFSSHVRIEFEFALKEIYSGPDQERPEIVLCEKQGRMLWIPNPGQKPQPLDKIASGGELSRFLLALVTIQTGGKYKPTLIFDEVDTGIGGLTLNSVGEKLRLLAEKQQMILISHWPQLAGLAKRHFLISKDVQSGETYTSCVRLGEEEIKQELSRMAGGGDQGTAFADQILKS